MARVAKIQGDVFDTVVVVPNTVEYALSTGATPNDGDIRVTPIILGNVVNTEAFNIPAIILPTLSKFVTAPASKK